MGALACVTLILGRDEWGGCAEGRWFGDVVDETNGMLITVIVVKALLLLALKRAKAEQTCGVLSRKILRARAQKRIVNGRQKMSVDDE